MKAWLLATSLLLFANPAMAGQAGDLARTHLYAGSLAAGTEALAPLAKTGDREAAFGLGLIGFVTAIEGFSQELYRHGFSAPDGGPMAGAPLVVPVPPNPDPEPLDYQKLRNILVALVNDLDAAHAILLGAGESGDYVVPLDVMQFHMDIDGDGAIAPSESVGAVLAAMLGADIASEPPPDATIGFDRADAIWLAGYSQVIGAWADLLLAHDFHELVESSFHRLFPRAGLPMQSFAGGSGSMFFDAESDNAIADLVAAIHTLDWPVTDPERLKRVLTRLGAVTALSRRNWQAILAETDDDRELLPNPRQHSIMPGSVITEAQVAAWMATLDTADQILAGKLLVPHWRFAQGIDLKAYFETAERTDLVMLFTGHGALPFLRDGPIASAESFRAANEVFGDALFGFALWFN